MKTMANGLANRLTHILIMLLAGSLLAACDIESYEDEASAFRSNNGNPAPNPNPNPNPNPDPDPNPNPMPPPAGFNPVFSEIQANVFTPTCATAGCHDATASGGLNLTAGGSHAMLVGIDSNAQPGTFRVSAGNPNGSYLIQKLEGAVVHPPTGALTQPVIDVIRAWITNGAIDDTLVPPAAPIQVSSIAPMPNQTLDAPPNQIVIGFTREPVAASVNANTIILERSGDDASFTNGNEVQIAAVSITVANNNPQTVVFDLTGANMPDDIYRLRVLGDGASVITDIDANALDGEFTGLLPSGNGMAGGDFISFFTISTPVVLGPTLDQIQAVVFSPSCATAGCHTGPAGNILPTGLDLTNANASFVSLVNAMSMQSMGETLVIPGDPDNSYLIQKLEGNGLGNVMPPPPRATLPPATIAVIRQWITDGALQ